MDQALWARFVAKKDKTGEHYDETETCEPNLGHLSRRYLYSKTKTGSKYKKGCSILFYIAFAQAVRSLAPASKSLPLVVYIKY